MNHRHLVCAIVAVLALPLVACGPSLAELKTAASKDLSCPEANLEVESRDWSVRTVKGCGRNASYVARQGDWHPLASDPAAP
jgi:hypothetical protein